MALTTERIEKVAKFGDVFSDEKVEILSTVRFATTGQRQWN